MSDLEKAMAEIDRLNAALCEQCDEFEFEVNRMAATIDKLRARFFHTRPDKRANDETAETAQGD